LIIFEDIFGVLLKLSLGRGMSSCIILIPPYSSIIGLKDPVCFILTFELGETTGEIAGVIFDIFDFVAEETLFWD
jgi:hypothetical protein